MKRFSLALAMIVSCALPAVAQIQGGSISGTVTTLPTKEGQTLNANYLRGVGTSPRTATISSQSTPKSTFLQLVK